MITILLSTNNLSPRETQEMIDTLSSNKNRLLRRGIQHSEPGETLKTTGFTPRRYIELYVPEASKKPILDFLKNHEKFSSAVIDDWESMIETTPVITHDFRNQANTTVKTEEPTQQQEASPLEQLGTAVNNFVDEVVSTPARPAATA